MVLTGAPGSGKTTLLRALAARGLATIEEPARRVLAETRATGTGPDWDIDRAGFVAAMLGRAIADFDAAPDGVTIFDRGIPDCLAYAETGGLADHTIRAAATRHRYEGPVFLAPPWAAIFTNDDERRMDFAAAVAFDAVLQRGWATSGYDLVALPLADVATRAAFVLERLSAG